MGERKGNLRCPIHFPPYPYIYIGSRVIPALAKAPQGRSHGEPFCLPCSHACSPRRLFGAVLHWLAPVARKRPSRISGESTIALTPPGPCLPDRLLGMALWCPAPLAEQRQCRVHLQQQRVQAGGILAPPHSRGPTQVLLLHRTIVLLSTSCSRPDREL